MTTCGFVIDPEELGTIQKEAEESTFEHEPYLLHNEWHAVYAGRVSPPFNCKGAALAWLAGCRKTGKYRS